MATTTHNTPDDVLVREVRESRARRRAEQEEAEEAAEIKHRRAERQRVLDEQHQAAARAETQRLVEAQDLEVDYRMGAVEEGCSTLAELIRAAIAAARERDALRPGSGKEYATRLVLSDQIPLRLAVQDVLGGMMPVHPGVPPRPFTD